MELKGLLIVNFLLFLLSIYLIKENSSNFKNAVTLALLIYAYPLLIITQKIFTQPFLELIYFDGLNIQLKLIIDSASLLFLWLNFLLFLFLYIFIYKNDYQNNLFHGLHLLLFIINNFFFIAGDTITFIIFWEAMLIPATLLLYYFSHENQRYIALQFLLYNFGFSIFLILGVLILYSNTESLDIKALRIFPSGLISFLIFTGIMVKTPVFPLHGWLLNTYYSLPSPVTAIFSGILSKYSLYALYRFYNETRLDLKPLLIITTISCIISALLALRERNLKKIFTFMSMSHLNIMIAGSLGMLPYTSMNLIIPFSFFHGFLAFILFLYVHYLEKLTGELNIEKYGNLTKITPLFTIFFTLYLLVLAGFPLFAYFYIEFTILSYLFKYSLILGFLLSVAIALNLVYKSIVFYKLIFIKSVGEASNKLSDLSFSYIILSSLISLLVIFLTIYFSPLIHFLAKGGL
ncbi:MAG: proton-conducting transporter membrane subunit [Caldimicrobium sp.]